MQYTVILCMQYRLSGQRNDGHKLNLQCFEKFFVCFCLGSLFGEV